MDEKPIFDFAPLRNFLIEKGYVVKQTNGYIEIKPEEVTIESIQKGELEVTNQGIYVIGPRNEKQQVFLYKRDYHLEEYGKPRFHICKCSTIDDFIASGLFKDHYVRANSCPVPVINLDNRRKIEEVDNLPLCQNCLNFINSYGRINSNQFVQILKQVNEKETKIEEVDIFGYTRDWDSISKNYREKHKYTCERCGLQIEDKFDRQYMHCHHKDADKLNNDDSNLECLCIRCHSEVDEIHHKRLTSGANACMMSYFNKKYPKNNHEDVMI